MTKTFEEEAIKEAKKCRVVMNAYDGESNPPKAGLNIKLGWTTHNFPWLEFAKNWHSDEEFQAEKDARKKEYEIHQDIYSKTAHSLTEAESEIANLKSQLQQQALPVVPECVAKWIEELKGKGYGPLKNPCTYGEAISELSDKSLEKILN